MAHPIYKTSDGKRVPSVTTVIGRFKDSGGLIHWAWKLGMDGEDYRKKRDKAADAGTLAHDMIEAHIKGWEFEPPADVDPEQLKLAEKGFDGFKLWLSSTKVEILETEVSLVSDEYRFGGTVDAIGRVNDSLCLLDWKTSNRIYADYIVQVSAYRYLWEHGLMNDRKADVPMHLGEPIEGLHLLRVGKEWGDFHHHCWPLEVLDMGWRQFVNLRKAYDLDGPLKRAV